ncbi:protein FAR1-RELATED SEQUENCE 5-like [Rhododendron vialii]|uniref:protein FAR1-RELATED SEQUENCE 5-like n=1 Tax=Rhododendron vialii TaxID=182163 RepID=UPI00265F9782|nr:protein FAR1-RELATED SEQUENCE 5-like [Rhododendron vialii]
METPNNSTNSKGVKVDSYDWESNSDSCSSSEDSQSNIFVSEDEDNDVDGEKEGEGSVSSVDDSFRLLTDTEIMEMKFVSEDEAGQFYNAYANAIGFSVCKYKSRPQKGNEIQRNVGMKPAQIMDYMTCQSGGFHNVGFTVKDLRNKLHSIRKEEIKNGDAEGALGYLSAQVSNDPLFFFKYTVDEDDRLETLFWTDGRSKMDYAAFGDVLVFDTTYRTNAYKKPFVILAGVSNNFTTTIFGCALLSKETEDTYNWVLSTFLEAMDGKRPISMVTDGDLAMRNAIRNIFPDVRHRLCSWHLERNAAKNVHIPEFVSDFTILMQMECDVEEFETLWADMVSHYGLETNAWVVEMYNNRERWAEAYLLGHFFAGMRSTQRCEGMNRYLNRFLTVRLRLFEFAQQYHRGLARMRVADAEAETATEHSTPVLITQLKSLEKNGTEVYTQYIFRFFQDEIQRAFALIVARRVDEMERRLYFIEMYSHPKSNWTVEYYPIDSRINCSCLMFESFGLPCCHMIVVMKYEHLPTILLSLVMRRWTRCGRPLTQQPNVCQISRSISHMARYGILSSGYKLMSFYASHAQDSFEDARQVVHEMTSWIRKRWEMGKNKECNTEIGKSSDGQILFGVGDPPVVKTKGNPGKKSSAQHSRNPRKCSHCKCRGHDKRTCPKLSSKHPIDDLPI